jgi:hypothetical protein
LAPKYDSVGVFAKSSQDGGDIRVGQKSLFYLKNSKSENLNK